ncbi:MAG: hypothetical protein HYY65_09465 [Candidatus Tectomicrobia bacterium]|uniref:Cytochrome C n=1 Tax=Tectimicrobiota bacterium TaxID=2528274 RepID=A0A932GQ24_UNCTE|nr:hypothetical protein [Candidatus Tectomicrobia bacterium]
MRRLIWLFFLPASLFLLAAVPQAAEQCITCHTNPAKLQALIRPPAEIAQEEGEG